MTEVPTEAFVTDPLGLFARGRATSGEDGCGCRWCKQRPPELRMPQLGMCHFPTEGAPCPQPAARDQLGAHRLFCETKPEGSSATHDAKRAHDRLKRLRQAAEQEHPDPRDTEPWTQAATALHMKLERLPDALHGRASEIARFVDEITALVQVVGDVRVFETELRVTHNRAESDRLLRATAEEVAEQHSLDAQSALEQARTERAARLAAETERAVALGERAEFQAARDVAQAQAEQALLDARAAQEAALADVLAAHQQRAAAVAAAEEQAQAQVEQAQSAVEAMQAQLAAADAEMRAGVEAAEDRAARFEAEQGAARAEAAEAAQVAHQALGERDDALRRTQDAEEAAKQASDRLREAERLVAAAQQMAAHADAARDLAADAAHQAQEREVALREELRSWRDVAQAAQADARAAHDIAQAAQRERAELGPARSKGTRDN